MAEKHSQRCDERKEPVRNHPKCLAGWELGGEGVRLMGEPGVWR